MAGFDLAQTDRLLTTTRAVRKRLDLKREVEPEVLEECLRIALQAPNASNQQQWKWLVITDADKISTIGQLYQAYGADFLSKAAEQAEQAGEREAAKVQGSAAYLAQHLAEVPAMILACAQGTLTPEVPLAGVSSLFGSIYPAVWNLQLALRTRGLGSVLTTLHLLFADQVAEMLGIPDDYTQVCLLPVAHAEGDFHPAPRQPLEQVVGWNGWDQARS